MNRYKSHLLSIVTALYWFSMYVYVPILPVYAASLGATHERMGLIVGAYGLTQLLLRVPLGITSDRKNKRKMFITLGLVISVASSLGMWLFPDADALLLLRGLSGVAAAAWVVFPVLFASYYPGQSAKAIGWINSVNFGGQMVGLLLGGVIAGQYGSEYTFLVAAIGGAAGILLSLGVVENPEINRKPVTFFDLVKTARNRTLLGASALALISQLLTYATVFAFTPIAAKKLGAGGFELGLLTTLSVLPAACAAAISGTVFTRSLGEKNTIITGFLVTAASCAYIPFAGDMTGLYISQIVGGFGRGLIFSTSMALSIHEIEQEQKATAMGCFQAIYAMGMFIGPVAAGAVSGQAGLDWSFWLTALAGTAGAALTMVWVKPDRLAAGNEHG